MVDHGAAVAGGRHPAEIGFQRLGRNEKRRQHVWSGVFLRELVCTVANILNPVLSCYVLLGCFLATGLSNSHIGPIFLHARNARPRFDLRLGH